MANYTQYEYDSSSKMEKSSRVANPYIVITPRGYTKHYYAGSERLATVIGGGGFNKMTSPIDTLKTHDNFIRANAFPYYERNDPFTIITP